MHNQRGQAAIFVALMFNVLFVFFAMTINVALVVHDKINLQNSVDMAAYYAAAKQAELLNVIAHENYMIRQSWKLLAWRYRALGTMGLLNPPHPARANEIADEVYTPAVKPVLCISYQPNWNEVPPDESLCNVENLNIPALPQVEVIFGGLGINQSIAQLSRQLRAQFDAQCESHAAHHWWFAENILYAYRIDQANRKLLIRALAQNLSNSQDDFIDLDGNSVKQGARQTFLKNLTFANRKSFDNGGGEFKLLNALGNVPRTSWLPEIDTFPTMYYVDVDTSSGCNAKPTLIKDLPVRPQAINLLKQSFQAGGLDAGNLIPWADDYPDPSQGMAYANGVEKNPWYMAYIGIKATTSPREIFQPVGGGVQMSARAFAKPFGGRIGPWFGSTWPQGAPQSNDATRVDDLLPPRLQAGGLLNNQDDDRRLPNYARFPGDSLGMASKLALNGLANLIGVKASFASYFYIKQDLIIGGMNDILAWDANANAAPSIRSFEIAAIAPDLFDITYYSIEPNFGGNYWAKLNQNRNQLQIPADLVIRQDLGQSLVSPNYAVQDQIAAAQSVQRPEAFYFVRNRAHLLTAWLPGPGAFNFDPQGAYENFGTCQLPDDPPFKYRNPGSCVAGGGRTGYSVKLMHRDALVSSQHLIGGPGMPPGPILNPPQGEW